MFPSSPSSAWLRPLLVSATCLCALLAAGCASPGDPRAPSLHLPKPAQKLTAQRVGASVDLTWDTPAGTTDGGGLRPPILAILCLDAAPPAATTRQPRKSGPTIAVKRKAPEVATPIAAGPPCTELKRLTVAPGGSSASVDLPPALITGTPMLLSFHIELLNGSMHSAGPSASVYAAGGEPPPPIGPLTVTARRTGALIRWQPSQSDATVEIVRTLTHAAPDAISASTPPQLGPARKAAPEVLLRSPPGEAKDAGGVLDTGVQDQATYSFVAQRVQTVRVGGRELDLRSRPSPAAIFTYRDTFPPLPPTGLVAIEAGGLGQKPSVDLSWDAAPETDLLGYSVFRKEDAGAWSRISPELLQVPAFRDLTITPGHIYTYRITATDQQHNESAPGSDVRQTVHR